VLTWALRFNLRPVVAYTAARALHGGAMAALRAMLPWLPGLRAGTLGRALPAIKALLRLFCGLAVIAVNFSIPDDFGPFGSLMLGALAAPTAGSLAPDAAGSVAAPVELLHDIQRLLAAAAAVVSAYACIMGLQAVLLAGPVQRLLRAPERRRLKAAKRELQTLADRALACDSLEEMIGVLREAAGRAAPGCTVLMLQHDGDEREVITILRSTPTFRPGSSLLTEQHGFMRQVDSASLPSMQAVCAAGQPYLAAPYPCDAMRRFAELDHFHEDMDMNAFLVLPLMLAQRDLGALLMMSPDPTALDASLRRLAAELAGQVSQALYTKVGCPLKASHTYLPASRASLPAFATALPSLSESHNFQTPCLHLLTTTINHQHHPNTPDDRNRSAWTRCRRATTCCTTSCR